MMWIFSGAGALLSNPGFLILGSRNPFGDLPPNWGCFPRLTPLESRRGWMYVRHSKFTAGFSCDVFGADVSETSRFGT
jgi:hypothetical protein